MNRISSFSPFVIEKLKYYVYVLVDDVTRRIYYVGKGKSNRVFESLKNKNNHHHNPLQAYIIRHSLSENEALLLEATLINLFPYFSFSDLPFNLQNGVDNGEKGIASVEDIESQYVAPIITEADFKHNVLIISINKSVGIYDVLLTPVRLYEYTRKSWCVNVEKAKKVDFVIAKYNGVLREIYKVYEWKIYQSDSSNKETNRTRYEFIGDVVMDSTIRELYLNKKLDKQRSYGQPLTYIINKELSYEGE